MTELSKDVVDKLRDQYRAHSMGVHPMTDHYSAVAHFTAERIQEATATLQSQCDRYRVVLEACADQFAFYAREHQSAGKTEKAATNQRFADLARTALSDNTTSEGRS